MAITKNRFTTHRTRSFSNIAGISYYFNLQYPSLVAGLFPMSEMGVVFPSHGYVRSSPNQTIDEFNVTIKEGYKFANLTLQVANTGKGSAYDVNVAITGSPSNECTVDGMTVYAGEPTDMNFLKAAKKKEYFVGMLLPQKFYVFVCSVRWKISSPDQQSFILSVTSSNAGTIKHIIMVN